MIVPTSAKVGIAIFFNPLAQWASGFFCALATYCDTDTLLHWPTAPELVIARESPRQPNTLIPKTRFRFFGLRLLPGENR